MSYQPPPPPSGGLTPNVSMPPQFGVSARQASPALPVLYGLTAVGCLLSGALPLVSISDDKMFDAGASAVLTILIPAALLLIAAVSAKAKPDMAGLGGGAALAAMSIFAVWATLIWKLTDGQKLGAGSYMMIVTAVLGAVAFLASLGVATSRKTSPALWLAVLAGFAMSLGCTLVPTDLGYDTYEYGDYVYRPTWAEWNYFGEGSDQLIAVSIQWLIWVPFVGLLIGAAKRGRFGTLLGLGSSSVLAWIVFATAAEIDSDTYGELSGLRPTLHPVATIGAVATVLLVLVALGTSNTSSAGSVGHFAGAPTHPPLPATAAVAEYSTPAVARPTVQPAPNPARWAADPFGRHENRYWDGASWTKHVADAGVAGVDRPVAYREVAPTVHISSVVEPSIAPPMPTVPMPLTPTAGQFDLDRTIVRQTPAQLMELVFDSGQRVTLVAPVIVGRAPGLQPKHPTATLLAFEDHTMSVSATHFVVGVGSGEAWVEDLGSTNGSSVTRVDGTSVSLSPGVRVAVAAGSEIRFGDRSARLVANSQAQS